MGKEAIIKTGHADLGNPAQTFVITVQYDAWGRVQTVEEPGGAATNYRYDSANRLAMVTDALGNKTRTAYDGLGRPLATIRHLTSDGTGAGTRK